MLTCLIFSRTIQVACQNGAMMETLWSSLIVRLKGSIEWSYQVTTPCNRILIWMRGAHLCHQTTPGQTIARIMYLINLWQLNNDFFRQVMKDKCNIKLNVYILSFCHQLYILLHLVVDGVCNLDSLRGYMYYNANR